MLVSSCDCSIRIHTSPPYLTVCLCCSHHDCAVCAWDVRNLVYPVHEGRLDHMAEPRHHFGLSNALWRAQNQAMTLSCSHDTMLGHAANGAPSVLHVLCNALVMVHVRTQSCLRVTFLNRDCCSVLQGCCGTLTCLQCWDGHLQRAQNHPKGDAGSPIEAPVRLHLDHGLTQHLWA